MQRILLIEDNNRYRKSNELLLSKEGYDVISFEDPISGIEKVGSEYVDLLINNLEMKEMTSNEYI